MKKLLKFAGKAFLAFSVVFTIAMFAIMFSPLANLSARHFLVESDTKKADIIIVLGGGAYPNSKLNGASNERLIHALLLYREGYSGKILFSGGTITDTARKIRNTLNEGDEKATTIESAIMRDIALKLGIPEKDLLLEASSRNTFENLKMADVLMAEKDFKTCLLVTSATHMRRALAVSRKLGMECYPAPVADSSQFRTGATERLALAREVLWEFLGLVIYRVYGYI